MISASLVLPWLSRARARLPAWRRRQRVEHASASADGSAAPRRATPRTPPGGNARTKHLPERTHARATVAIKVARAWAGARRTQRWQSNPACAGGPLPGRRGSPCRRAPPAWGAATGTASRRPRAGPGPSEPAHEETGAAPQLGASACVHSGQKLCRSAALPQPPLPRPAGRRYGIGCGLGATPLDRATGGGWQHTRVGRAGSWRALGPRRRQGRGSSSASQSALAIAMLCSAESLLASSFGLSSRRAQISFARPIWSSPV